MMGRSTRFLVVAMLVSLAVPLWSGAAGGQRATDVRVQGAGITMLEGGTGAPDFVPVLTKLAFHWNGTNGRLECLALAPGASAGDPGSGDFDTNAMYVTGPITSGIAGPSRAVLEGTATVTGLGAGEDVPFTLVAFPGGPGTRIVLRVSGLVFREIMLDGEVTF